MFKPDKKYVFLNEKLCSSDNCVDAVSFKAKKYETE